MTLLTSAHEKRKTRFLTRSTPDRWRHRHRRQFLWFWTCGLLLVDRYNFYGNYSAYTEHQLEKHTLTSFDRRCGYWRKRHPAVICCLRGTTWRTRLSTRCRGACGLLYGGAFGRRRWRRIRRAARNMRCIRLYWRRVLDRWRWRWRGCELFCWVRRWRWRRTPYDGLVWQNREDRLVK